MNNYESIIILSQAISDESKLAVAEKVKELIQANGELKNVEEWGRKTLAYEIKKQKEGFYILFTFSVKPESISELDRILGLDESVLKHIIIKK